MRRINLMIILCLFISTIVGADEIDGLQLKLDINLNYESTAEPIVPLPVTVTVPVVETALPLVTIPVPTEEYPPELIAKIKNDKEVQITSFDSYEILRIQKKFTSLDQKTKIIQVFTNSLHDFLNNKDMHCELRYIAALVQELQSINIKISKEELLDIFKMLRVNNVIDDIYYDILESLLKDYFALGKIKLTTKPIKNFFKNYEEKIAGYDLNVLFASFKKYPDEVESCSYVEFFRVREKIGTIKDTIDSKNSELKDLAYMAFTKNIISLETFNRIKFLTKDSTIQSRQVWLNDYFKIIFSAKNKMIPLKRNYKVVKIEAENSFSTERLSRFSKMTRRKLLYQKYNEGQIILLTQVMKKASQRMGVDPDTKTGVPYLIQEFNILQDAGVMENLVEKIELDTQDQFNFARRLLRKDMIALQMMKVFQSVTITYEDLVMASLETGYISLDDIEYVVKYDDLWNPEISKFERLTRMTFRVAGYSTFFLPPPWNVTAALTLTVIDGIVESKTINGASNDNPNTFIE
jgi:hypothetical protein